MKVNKMRNKNQARPEGGSGSDAHAAGATTYMRQPTCACGTKADCVAIICVRALRKSGNTVPTL